MLQTEPQQAPTWHVSGRSSWWGQVLCAALSCRWLAGGAEGPCRIPWSGAAAAAAAAGATAGAAVAAGAVLLLRSDDRRS